MRTHGLFPDLAHISTTNWIGESNKQAVCDDYYFRQIVDDAYNELTHMRSPQYLFTDEQVCCFVKRVKESNKPFKYTIVVTKDGYRISVLNPKKENGGNENGK